MSSIYFDIMVSNSRAYSVSIRKMSLPQDGFGVVWAYEITPSGSPTPLRGTVSDVAKEELLTVVHAVLTDYLDNVGTFHQTESTPVENV
jgi:hypothetical protein